MTGKERLKNISNRLPIDRISWTTLVDDVSRSIMPDEIRKMPVFDFYRYIGCDILQFGNYGLSENYQISFPCRLVTPEIETEEDINSEGILVRTQRSSWGTLTATFKEAHPIKYPVESITELQILKNIWRKSYYEKRMFDEEPWDLVNKEIGENGIYVPTFSPSPIQQLLQYDIGVANFYYLLQDYKEEIEELLSIMENCRVKEYDICARKLPTDAVVLVENTSTTMIDPLTYQKYNLPQVRDFVDIMHKYDKKVIIHMCGRIKNLLSLMKEMDFDGINGLTPPPIGDTLFEDALDVLGDNLIILGGVLNPDIFHRPSISKEEIYQMLEKIFTPRIRTAHFLLWVQADGIPTNLDKFMSIRDWFKKGI